MQLEPCCPFSQATLRPGTGPRSLDGGEGPYENPTIVDSLRLYTNFVGR